MPSLIELLEHKDKKTRWNAVCVVGAFTGYGNLRLMFPGQRLCAYTAEIRQIFLSVIPSLVLLLGDEYKEIRERAIHVIAGLSNYGQ